MMRDDEKKSERKDAPLRLSLARLTQRRRERELAITEQEEKKKKKILP